MSIIGKGAAAENGSGAGRWIYQNNKLPCSKAAANRAEKIANSRRYLSPADGAIKGKPSSLDIFKAEGKNSDMYRNWSIDLNMFR